MTSAVSDPVGPSFDWSLGNPLRDDVALFEMYTAALGDVLGRPEIRDACDEFDLSVTSLRTRMTIDAARVFAAAPNEFEAYRQAVAQELATSGTGPAQVTHGRSWDLDAMARAVPAAAFAIGAVATVIGAATSVLWDPMTVLAQAGATVLVVSVLLWAGRRFFGDGLFKELGFTQFGSRDLGFLRAQLIAAVSETEMLAQVRTIINAARQDRFGHLYSVAGAHGLSEVYDSTNLVPTKVGAELDELLNRFGGASVGVAGPRGSGKSTLVRQYCQSDPATGGQDYEELDWLLRWGDLPQPARDHLRCFAAAPVDYVARDFVLHLFATFCRAVISEYGPRTREFPWYFTVSFWARVAARVFVSLLWRGALCAGAVFALLHYKHTLAHHLSVPVHWVEYAALAVVSLGALDFARSAGSRILRSRRRLRGKDEHALAVAARKQLVHVRYLQTYTSGWSGTVQLPWSGASGQYSRSVARAEQPQSFPEIVDEFRDFAREVAEVADRYGTRVFIGIDELDKIASAEQAERFLNEIKGIFGIPHVCYMVSVSDDALTAFDRRGLPLRNAFDSSFDEIIYVAPLSYDESRRLLYRRVIGLTEPFVALCHCLAGGLARDVIRAAREVVRAGAAGRVREPSAIAADDAEEYGIEDTVAYLMFQNPAEQAQVTLGTIATAVVHDEMRRKLRAVSSVAASNVPAGAEELHDTLYQARQALLGDEGIIGVVDLMTAPCPEEPPELTGLRLDFAAYAYYCATLQEVFTDELDQERLIAATGSPADHGSFDSLARARAAFSVDTMLAWRMTTRFREAWNLETREPRKAAPGPEAHDQAARDQAARDPAARHPEAPDPVA